MWTWCQSVCEAAGNNVHGTSGKPSATAASNGAVQWGNGAPMVPVVVPCAPALCLGHQGKPGVPCGDGGQTGMGKWGMRVRSMAAAGETGDFLQVPCTLLSAVPPSHHPDSGGCGLGAGATDKAM